MYRKDLLHACRALSPFRPQRYIKMAKYANIGVFLFRIVAICECGWLYGGYI